MQDEVAGTERRGPFRLVPPVPMEYIRPARSCPAPDLVFSWNGTLMHGRTTARMACCLAFLLALPGCDDAVLLPDTPEGPAAEAASQFDPACTGTIEGRVIWVGKRPVVVPYRAPVSPLSEQAGGKKHTWPNPHAPAITGDGGVAGAVVFLCGVDPRRARPWDHPPVRVELRAFQARVIQGGAAVGCGFVRRGDTVAIASAQDVFHALRARGAAFFALTFPPGGRPCTRRLDRCGAVELTSAAGYFWMRGHLFVDDHPYYTRSDAAGRFTLPQVPPGTYEVVCWLPDWRAAGEELDADTGLVTCLTFRPPLARTRSVTVQTGRTTDVPFRVTVASFGR